MAFLSWRSLANFRDPNEPKTPMSSKLITSVLPLLCGREGWRTEAPDRPFPPSRKAPALDKEDSVWFSWLGLFRRLRWKVSVAALFALFVLGCGALSAFVLAPQQALLAWRIDHIPQMDVAAVEAAAPGADVLVTGVLEGNPPSVHDFVTYTLERWEVKTDSEGQSYGRWVDVEGAFPDLRLVADGQPLLVQGNIDVRLLGAVHMEMYQEGSDLRVPSDTIPLSDGTLRYHGLRNGDRVTVLGRKAASGGIVPSHLFAGDRVTFQESQRSSGWNLFLAGLCVMALSPLVFVFTLAILRR